MLEFYRARTALSEQQRSAWQKHISALSKVGIEIEYNLKENKGMCNGEKPCGCVSFNDDNDCWRVCVHEHNCQVINRSPHICENICPTCSQEDCPGCSLFKFSCKGVECSLFMVACATCDHFDAGCASCEYRYNPEMDPEKMRSKAIAALCPSRSYGRVTGSGVFDVITDGSLLGGEGRRKGMEIITSGRRPNYWKTYDAMKHIMDVAKKNGGYMNERSSIHMHLLLSYYKRLNPEDDPVLDINELDEPMPEIILANLHQLVARYQNALVWMGMGLDSFQHLTRWAKFRVSVMGVSAVTSHMKNVREYVSRNAGGNKYGFINYLLTEFSPSGDINRFHVEFRGLDGIESPSAVAAFSCLYTAMLSTAVDLSVYGVLKAFGEDEYKYEDLVRKRLLNNMKGYGDGDRFGHTSKLSDHYDHLARRSMELLGLVKHHLEALGPAYEVLREVATKPLAIRRAEGMSWEEIEEAIKAEQVFPTGVEKALRRAMDCMIITGSDSPESWIEQIARRLEKPRDQIEAVVEKMVMQGRLFWSHPLGMFKPTTA